jgi:lysophospholipase L1-like esterase
MLIQPGDKLLMIGDSVTDCDRSRSDDAGLFDSLGNGYVSLVNGLLMARYPSHGIRVINRGVSGNTVRDLKDRWQTDVLDLHPDWLSVGIGINDVWRQFDSPEHPEWGVPLDEYTHALQGLLSQTRPSLKGLVLITPYLVEPDHADPMRLRMEEYIGAVRRLAATENALLVDS